MKLIASTAALLLAIAGLLKLLMKQSEAFIVTTFSVSAMLLVALAAYHLFKGRN